MSSFDVVVVGAGIVGAACADSLAREGLSVLIIDSHSPASGTTAAGMGHIVVMDDSEAQLALTAYSRGLWHELAAELPPSCEYERCGTAWVAADDEEMAEARRKHDLLRKHGIRSDLIDDKALSEAEPNLRDGLAGGLVVPEDAVVYQPAAARALIDRAVSMGAEARSGAAVGSIEPGMVTLKSGETISAGKIVNAAGADAHRLSPQLRITPKKGHLVITDRYPGTIRHQVLELGYSRSAHGGASDSVAFNVQPRRTGQVLVGSSRQLGKCDTQVDRDMLRQMALRAFEYMPVLQKMSAIRVWTGIRPATGDNLPYIGEIPATPGIFVAAGHEGLGITTSLGTAALLRDLITGRDPAIPADAYSPARVCR